MSKDKILKDVRNSAVKETISRYHLLERKDIQNIEWAYGLKDVQRHPNDQQSVLSWNEEWSKEEHNPILAYKLQGQEAEDGQYLEKNSFFVAVQTPLQKEMLIKLGHKGVCCDSTHGTNGYDFSLSTILVIDEFGQGFPVAWCLSSHEDITTLCTFFNEIKDNCGAIHSKFFMSDMAPQFYNAWVHVMQHKPAKLICTWHTDRAWQFELKKKNTDKSVHEEVYKMLRTLLSETNKVTFSRLLTSFIQHLKKVQKTSEFHTYFEKEWVPKISQWAYCYRQGMGINTNMYAEAFHRVFKRNYLKGKVNKRVDKCLVNLIQFVRDKAFDRMIKITKGKLTYRLNNIHKRHQV